MTRNHSLITQKYYTAEGVTASSIGTLLHITLDLIQKWFIYALYVYVFLLSLSSVQSVISNAYRRLGLRSAVRYCLCFTYWMIRAGPVCRAGSLCQVAGLTNEGLV